jgi:hypothetical protein
MRGTRGALRLGHVSPYYSLPTGHVSPFHWTTLNQYEYATSSNYHVINCQDTVRSPHQHCTALPRGDCTDCMDRSVIIIFFCCLARRTDRDNFSIRTPFAKVNIPPESGRRDGRNGTIFIAFRAL